VAIRDAANDVMQEREVRDQITQIQEDRLLRLGAVGQPPRPAQGSAAEAGAIAGETRRQGTSEIIQMGGTAGNILVHERQTYSSRPGHIHTEGLGKSGTYAEAAEAVGKLRHAGLSNADIAEAMLALSQGRSPGQAFRYNHRLAATLGAATRLLLQVESGRSPSQLITALMGIETLKAGVGTRVSGGGIHLLEHGATVEDLMTTMNTMEQKGAVGAARGVANRLGVPIQTTAKGFATHAKQERMLAQERQLAEAWVYTLITAKQPMFQTMGQWTIFIKKELRGFLAQQGKLMLIKAPPRD
jgi:hypothetical protein